MTNSKKILSNLKELEIPGVNDPKSYIKPVDEISKEIVENAGNAPYVNYQGQLFGIKRFEKIPSNGSIWHMSCGASLTSWISEYYSERWVSGKAKYEDGSSGVAVTKPELLKRLAYDSPSVDGLEFLPHYPNVPGVHYLRDWKGYEVQNTGKFDYLISLLNAASDLDRDMLKAMFLTPMWGGGAGQRPLFYITTDYSRGVGKTTTIDLLSAIYGGSTRMDPSKIDGKSIGRALGSPLEISKRIVFYDNCSGKIDSDSLTTNVTGDEIIADILFKGAFYPKNLKTWILTLNDGEASTDIASRALVIKIGRSPHGLANPNFKTDTLQFIEENREEIIGDILWYLKEAPLYDMAPKHSSRWKAWENDIIRKFPRCNEILEEFAARRTSIDTESEEAEDLATAIKHLLIQEGLDPESCNVCIPLSEIQEILDEYMTKEGVRDPWKIIAKYGQNPALSQYGFQKKRLYKKPRGLFWYQDSKKVVWWDDAIQAAKEERGTPILTLGFSPAANDQTAKSGLTEIEHPEPSKECGKPGCEGLLCDECDELDEKWHIWNSDRYYGTNHYSRLYGQRESS